MTLLEFGDGCFPDVCVCPDGRWLLTYREGDPKNAGRVVVRREGENTPIYSIDLGPGPAFPRVSWPWVAYSSPEGGKVVQLLTGQTISLGSLWGNEPLALSSQWCAYQASPAVLWLRALTEHSEVLLSVSPRPTGLVSVNADGTVVRVDDVRTSVAGMLNPRTAGALTVGECDPPAALCRRQDGIELRLWPGLDSFTPHVATDGARYFISTWGSRRVRLAVLTEVDFKQPVVPPSPIPSPLPLPTGVDMRFPNGLIPVLRSTGHCPLVVFRDPTLPDREFFVELVDGSVHVEIRTPSGQRLARSAKLRPVRLVG